MNRIGAFLSGCRTWQLFAAAFLLVWLVYWPSTRYEFVGLDDPEYITENGHVLTGLSRTNLVWAVTSCGYAQNWHPLAWISLQADASLARPSDGRTDLRRLSRVMHAHNVMLHALNAVLLMALILIAVRNRYATLFFALLWAIHPLRTEIVCWATERKELVSVCFMLLTMILYCGARPSAVSLRSAVRTSRPTGYVLSLFTFILALLAKPVAVTLPCLLFAWDWVVRRERLPRCLLKSIPFFALSGATCALTLAAQGEALDVGRRFSAVDRLVMTLNAPIVYLRQTLWPAKLSSFYPTRPPLDLPETLLGAALIAFMAWVAVRWLRRRERWTGACVLGIAWCYVGLLPMLGIVKVGDQSHSDRYTYWVGCGVAALLAWAVARVRGSERFRRVWKAEWTDGVSYAALGVVVLACVLTRRQMPVWRDMLSHYRNGALTWWVESPVCHFARALQKLDPPDLAGAERILREGIMRNDAVEIRAEFAYFKACHCEPTPLWDGKDGMDPAFAEAKADAELAVRADPTEARGYEALGVVYLRNAMYGLAEANLMKARELWSAVKGEERELANIDLLLGLCRKESGDVRK